ncbi:MAG: DoxX family protein [Haliea sp.]|nr:DoxX family protein [Haliea sp.]MBK6739095.1 DoxX family protein [Haliea sp.]
MTQLHNSIHSANHSAVHSTTANAPRAPADWRSDLLLFSARLFPAAIFWQSGQTKLDGWRLSDSAVYLFQQEYRLPLLDPELAARMATGAEHLFPLLLVLGLATRLSALALLGMTLVIQCFVYPQAWPTHGTWAVAWLLLIHSGPGRLSLDHLTGWRVPALENFARKLGISG